MGDEAPRRSDGGPSEGGESHAGLGDAPGDDRQADARRAVAAQRIAALALAKNDDDLTELQRAGFAPERTPSRDRLAVAKALVDRLGDALESNAEGDWEAVDAAFSALREVADEAALTDRDRGGPDVASLSTDAPPPPEPGMEPTQRGDEVDLAAHLIPPPVAPPPLGGIGLAPDSSRTVVSASAVSDVPEETMVSAVPVDAVVAELAQRARAARQGQLQERTLVEAGMIEDAMSRARELLDHAQVSARPATESTNQATAPSADEGGTVQLSFSSMAHGFALTVEEYAALCAERDEDPSRLGALRARYGIAEVVGHAALDRYFEQLFVRDPAMRTLWQRHYRHYTTIVQGRSAQGAGQPSKGPSTAM